MATNVFANITQKGTLAQFSQALETAPNIWRNHVMEIPSDAPTETHVFAGTLPVPREFISGREFGGIRDFKFDVPNKTFELSFMIDRESMEDDRHGLINRRIAEAAEVWATFKDFQFAALLTDGDSALSPIDALAFFHATRTIGGSSALDNIDTTAAATDASPTATEVGLGLQSNLILFAAMEDDQGRIGYNANAVQKLRVIAHPAMERGFVEFLNSTLLSSSDNPWGKGLAEFDSLPYLTPGSNQYFLTAVGSTRRPFIYQERTGLEIVVFTETKDIALNNGVMVLTRQRYRLEYGDFRRCIQHTYT